MKRPAQRNPPPAPDDAEQAGIEAKIAAILAVPKAEVDALEAERQKRLRVAPKPPKPKE